MAVNGQRPLRTSSGLENDQVDLFPYHPLTTCSKKDVIQDAHIDYVHIVRICELLMFEPDACLNTIPIQSQVGCKTAHVYIGQGTPKEAFRLSSNRCGLLQWYRGVFKTTEYRLTFHIP